MLVPRQEVIALVEMKTRRAQLHLNVLEREIATWLGLPPYTVTFEDDFDRALQIWRIALQIAPEAIPMSIGDFVCCLRSALDQLAWGLAHLDLKRSFTEREERNISFLIFNERNSTYEDRRLLFPPAVADVFDSLQPYHGGHAYRDNPLWQLNELWTLDKHRGVPINCNSLHVRFPMQGWENYVRHFYDGIEVHFPLLRAWTSPADLKPSISMEVLFGEYMGAFEVSLIRLREINDFVRNGVIPRKGVST